MTTMKLYSVLPNGPPSLTCQMALKALNIDYELVNEVYVKGDQMTDDCSNLNPQKEIPVLVDGEDITSGSLPILLYLGNKYDLTGKLYPKDPNDRVSVNRRLSFNSIVYYRSVSDDVMDLQKVEMALDDFEGYFERYDTRFAALATVTLADFALITSTMCLESVDISLDAWPQVKKWYEHFKARYPDLWKIAARGMREISHF